MKEIYSREQKRVALTFNVFMKASFVPGRLIVNKIKTRRFTPARFITRSLPLALPVRTDEADPGPAL
jgi:hypothetical protein